MLRYLVTTLHPYQFMARDTEFSLNFLLLSMDVAVPTLDPMVPVPTLGDVILDKLYNDETHEDVLFIFNPPSDIMTTANKSGVAFDVVSHSNVDANKSAEYSRTPAEDPSTPNKPNDNASKIDHDTDRSKWKAFSTGYSTDDTTGVYKLALCQWPYFKAMFEGDFAEGDSYTQENSTGRQTNNGVRESAKQSHGRELGIPVSTRSSLRHPGVGRLCSQCLSLPGFPRAGGQVCGAIMQIHACLQECPSEEFGPSRECGAIWRLAGADVRDQPVKS